MGFGCVYKSTASNTAISNVHFHFITGRVIIYALQFNTSSFWVSVAPMVCAFEFTRQTPKIHKHKRLMPIKKRSTHNTEAMAGDREPAYWNNIHIISFKCADKNKRKKKRKTLMQSSERSEYQIIKYGAFECVGVVVVGLQRFSFCSKYTRNKGMRINNVRNELYEPMFLTA